MANPLLTDEQNRRLANQNSTYNQIMQGFAPVQQPQEDSWLGGLSRGAKAGFGGLGAGLLHAGQAAFGTDGSMAASLDAMAENNAQRRNWDLADTFSLDYLTSPDGLAYGLGQIAGSMALPALFGAGVAAAVPSGGTSLLGTGALIGAAGAAPMAISEGGNTYAQGLQQGMTEEEAKKAGLIDAGIKLPFYMASEGLTGKLAQGLISKGLLNAEGKSLARRAAESGAKILGNAGNEAYEEGTENRSSAYALGDPRIGNLANVFNPFDWNDEDKAQAVGVFTPTLALGTLTGGAGHLRSRFNKKNSDVSEEIASEDGGTIEEAPEATVSGREAFINAIAGQESGGSYNAENSDTGAYGKYQILPSNWPEWAEEAGIGADAPRTPENQEIVARFKLGQYYDKYGARGAAIAWYGGEGALNYSEEALNRKQGDNGEYPSINEYADEVLGRMGNVADSVRIDDTEENYFDESDSMGLPKLSTPTAKGFDVSHLVDEEAQDTRELFGEKQDENIGKQNLGNDFFSNIKVEQDKRAKAIKDIARAVSQPNTFDELRNSIPSNYLEQMQKARAVVPVNNNAVGRPIPSQTETALTMQRGRNGGLNTDELAIMQKYQGNPDAFNRQFKKSVEAVRDAVNRGDITPDVGRAYMQNLGNMYNTVAGTVQNDGVILQGQDPAIIKMLGNLRDKRRRGDTGALPSLLQENGNADRSAAFANRNNPLAPLNLPVRTPKEWDKAEAEYKARAEEKAEKHTRQQTITDIINARAAQKWDEAENTNTSTVEKGIDLTLPKGVTAEAKSTKNKKTGKKEVELKFSGKKISDEFKKKLRAHGFNWNVGRKAWVAEENIVTKAVADKLTQKDNGEAKGEKQTKKTAVPAQGKTDAVQEQRTQAKQAIDDAPKGKTVEATTDNGVKFDVQYAIVPADSLITSNNASDFSNNEAYPQELQPRDRNRAYMRLQVEKMSGTIEPERITAGTSVNEGAPVVNKDGVVENGNGRTMALVRMWRSGNKKLQKAYRDYLIKNAVKFGFLSGSIKGISNPILVRIHTDNNVSVSEVTDSTKGGAQLSTAEQALQDSKKLKDSTLAKYEQNRLGAIDNAKNTEFIRAVFKNIIPEDELNAYTTADGSLSKSGKQRAVNAILAKAYGADPVLFNLVESTDEAYGKIGDALIAAAPTIAKLKALASNQTLFDVDLAGEILKAIKFVSNAKANNMAVFDAVNQQSMFADYNVDELTKKLALFIDNNKGAKWKNIVDMVTVSADVITKKGSPLQGNVFGEEVKAPTAEEVLTTAINRVTNGEATAIIRMNDEKGQIEIKFVGNVSESVKKKLAKAKYKLSLEEQMWHADKNATSMKVAKELGYEEQGGNNDGISIFDEETQAESNTRETESTEAEQTEAEHVPKSNQDEVKETTEQPTKKSFFQKRNEQTSKDQQTQNKNESEQGEKLNIPKGTTAEVSIVGDNSNIIQVKFNGEQGKNTSGILGRAGYKWKSDKQVWQARKTEKAMDVAEQLGYTEEAKPQERDYELEYDELWDTFATKLGIDNILSVDKAHEELKGVEGLHDGAIVYYDNDNRLYHIISKVSDPEMSNLGYNYRVMTCDVHHIPISVGSVKTADEVIKRVTGLSKQKIEPKTQAKPSADTFSKNPDTLFNTNALAGAPKQVTDIIQKMPKAEQSKTAKKQTVEKQTQEAKEPATKKSKFDYGDKNAALKDLLSAMGLKEKKAKVEDVEGIDYSDDGLAAAFKDLAKECSKLSANPMFNPALYRAAAKVGLALLKRTGRSFKRWAKAMLDMFRKNSPEEETKIKPFLGAIYKNIENWPKDLKFKEDIVELSCRLVGGSYAEGNTSFEAVYRDIVDMAGAENAQALRGYLEQAYLAVDELENPTLTLDENVVESKQDNTEGGKENGIDRQPIQTGDSSRSGAVRRGVSSSGEAVHAGGRGSERPNSLLGREPSEDGGTSEKAGDSSGVRNSEHNQSGRPAGKKSELGNVHNGREGERGTEQADVAGSMGRGSRGTDGGRTGVTTNYHIEDPDALIGGTPKVRFLRNKKAIEVVQELLDNERPATKEERDAMAAYTGWGSFGQELFQGTWENPIYKDGWKEENDWLRDTLGKDAWKEAQNSIVNAHYTDPYTINSMWEMVKNMGFKGGKVLEPSMGVGNFFGLMPKDIAEKSQLTGIELDRTTGRMAQALYPQANIQIKGYEESRTPDNFYDMIIGNVPFGNFNIADRRYGKLKPLIHDFFFLKGIDQLKPGGIMMAITTKGTLDKADARVRMELAKKADLVAAYRLPTGAFDKYAGTNVVTDILVFKKLDKPRTGVRELEWVNSSKYQTTFRGQQETYYYNDYFKNHPENVLGIMGFGHGTTTGRPGLTVKRLDDFGERLKEIPNEVPKNILEADKAQDNIQYISNHKGGEQGSVTAEDGKLYTVYGDQLKPLADTKKYSVKSDKQTAQRIQEINDWIKLRDTLGALYDAERTDAANMEKLRAELNKVFDDYCAKYVKQGKWDRKDKDEQPPFRQSFVNKYMKSIEEPSAARVMALVDDNGNKAAIFSKRSVRGSNTDIKNPTISQALIMQRNENVNLDIGRIAELAKKSKADVISELTKSGTIFKTPAGNYEVKDVYLSGNVRQKLREAEDALQSGDKDMQTNIEALKKVIPETVPYYNISTSMGATWIPQDVYRQFIAHLLGVDSIDNIKLTRTKGYSVELGKGYNNLNAATTVYGLSEIPFSKLLTHAFNHTKPAITMHKGGEVVEDTEAMNKANDKLEKIYDEFNDWLWKDNSRKLQLEHEYNEIMNAIAVPTYDGSFMDMPGMALLRGNSQFNLRQHQLNAIYRGLINGSGVYAHEVGTGKTYTMAGLAVESRRYGLAKKPLLLAFNANSASVAKEINDMYPGAKVLYIDNLDRKNIKLKLEQIRTDDWDCVVMPHSLVDKLSFKEETLMAMAEQQIYELEQAAIDAAAQDGEKISVKQMEEMRTAGKDEKVKGVRSTTAKKLVTMRNKIINQIKQSALNASSEDAISFEDLGIDMVLVDEAHAFKKPPFATTRKIKGLTTESSNRSIQLSFITQYIQSINDGRGVHLFTGTPITNTLTEMYHMMRYVMPKAMEDAGIKDFDSWMNSFAEETADMEFTSTGDVEMVSRLASFTNVPELRRFVGQYWDTVFADDMPEFKPRETANGKTITDNLTDKEQDELLNGYTENPQGRPYKKVIVETLKLTNSQNTILNDLVKKAKRYKDATKQERKRIARQEFHATPLLISNDASLAGMDPRLYDININTQGEETKIDRCVSNVAKIYKEGTDAHPTVQVIFTDVGYSDTKTRSIPQRTGFGAGDFKSVKETVPTFNMAKALVKQLTEQGIPENEIVVMKASYSPEKRAQIADMLKAGKYRVVIGSTATLGVGVNMQDNLRAMHHLDCPWMPGDLTQRNGRGHRQGNHWNTVLEYRYVTEKLDTKRWQTVLRKDAFINSFMKSKVGDNSVRAFEMGADDMNDKDTDSDLLQTLSEASGDPRVLIQKKYETNLAKLERKERTFIAGIEDIKGRLKYIDSVIEHKKDEWKALSADAETFAANKKADFEIKLVSSLKVGASRKLVTFDNRTDAQKHLGDILKQVMDIGVDNRIGEYTGFEVVVRKEASSIDGTYQPVIRLNGATTHLCGTPSIGGIASKAANIPGRVGKAQTAYEQAKKDKTELQKAAQETFPQQEQLDKTRKQLEEVKQDRMLSPTPPPEWLVNGVSLSSTFYVDDKPYSLSGYRANSDGYYLVGEANGEQRVFPFQDATDIQGMKVYDMTNHVPSPAYKAPSAEDIKNATANNTQYSVSSEAVQRAKEEVEAEIKKALPGAELEQRADGSYIATMPNGKRLGIVIEDQILLNERQAEKAGKAHNRAASEAEGYWSRWEQLDGKNIDGVIRLSRNSRAGTAFHETLHAAMDLCLTDKEKAALHKAFAKKAKESGRNIDEEIADAYKEWAIKRQSGRGSMFGKLFQKVTDFLNKLYTMFVEANNKGNIFRKLESGEAWKQQGEKSSQGAQYAVTNNAITGETLVPIVDVSGLSKTDISTTALKSNIARGLIGKTFRIIGSNGIGKVASVKDGKHLLNSSKVRARNETARLKALTAIDDVLNNAVYVEKHSDERHGSNDKYIELYAVVKNNDNLFRFRIVAKEGDNQAGAYEVKTAKFYDIIKDGKVTANTQSALPAIIPDGMKGQVRGTLPSTISVAKLLAGVKGRDGKLLVNKNGGLNYNSEIFKGIKEPADYSVKYSVASPKHKIANAFTNTERKGVVDSVKDFFKEHRKSLYDDWWDKNNPLKGFDALTKATGGLSVYEQAQSLPATTAGMLKALTEGTAQHVKMANQHLKNVKMKYNVTLAMALDKINKKQMDKAHPKYLEENGFDSWVNAFGAYLGAERCLEMAQLARAEGKTYKFPKGLTESECREFSKNAPAEFKAAADIFYKVNDNVISIMEDAQVFDHALAQTLRTKYKKYCPLLRDFSDTAAADSFIGGLTEGGRGIGNVSVPLKRINIEGSERGVLNPLETILKSYAVMLNRAERNKVALMAVENSKTADLHELIQEVPGTTADPKNCVFTVLINGKKKAFKTTQDLYGPIVGYNLPAANLALGVARTAARMLRTGATMSPSFIVRNVLRDTVFAGISSKNGFIPIVDTIRGAIALAKDPAMRAEFEAAGVTEFNFYSSQKARIKSLDAMADETPTNAWEIMKAVFSKLEAASDFWESSTRMGEYMKARKNNLSMEEAARAAREVTIDFSRSGRLGEQVNQIIPFFNACLQGGDKMVRLFREDFTGTSLKVFKYIVLPSLLIMAMNWDEDWYKDLDPDIKNNYWCLGRNIRIPKPQEAGVLFGSGIEALFQQAAGKDKDAVSNFLKAFSSNMLPNVLPTLMLPLIEWSANYSFYKGRPIVGNKYSRLPDELQYNDYTSELSKGIGSALKVSPMKIDNLVRGYTGTMGSLLWSIAGEPFAKANNLPAKHFNEMLFVRDFNVTDANLSRPMNEFYGILDKANRQHAGYGVKGKPEAAVKGIRSAGAMIGKIRKDIDKITHSNLSPERKRELIDKRKEKMNQIAKQATARYGKYFD